MRFITEFELVPPAIEARLDAYKSRSEFELGQLIAQSFDWKNRGYVRLNDLAGLRYTLEIEAFPFDKWVEFKEKLMDHFTNDATTRMLTSRLLEELESFCKPVTANNG